VKSLVFRLAVVLTCSPIQTYADQPRVPLPDNVAQFSESGWTTISFVDLSTKLKAACVSDTPLLLRCNDAVRINGLSNTAIAGMGVRIEFTNSAPGKGGIALTNAQNIRLSNLEIGWEGGGVHDTTVSGQQRLQTFGSVRSCSTGDDGGILKLDLPLTGSFPINTISVWDDVRGWPWYRSSPDVFEIDFPSNARENFSRGQSRCIATLRKLVGQRVLVRHIYTNHAIDCANCNRVTFEGIRVNSAPGMGFVFGRGSTNIIVRGNVIAPRCAPHCKRAEPSIFADGIHFAGGQGHILIEGNDFGWNGDDSVNITGLLLPAKVADNPGEDGLLLTIEEKWWNGRAWQLTVGELVRVYDRGFSELGQAKVIAVNPNTHQLSISRLPSIPGDVLIVEDRAVPANVIIQNNRFHDHRARGILIGASNALIQNNSIERVTGAAILIPADDGPNYEGPGAENVTIRENRISDVNRHANLPDYPSAISAGIILGEPQGGRVGAPIKHIDVERNQFTNVFTNADKPITFSLGVADGTDEPNRR
jgi:pectate lyase